ncbi:hypothetical protein Patl1_22344 [Pistacia atlantica]|uniref:Uncharacterized protein n=1 Tax=Pistacia atlantica TaxID=434234 RepID=A0ACC0ZWM6_9ROSI|nr:hypothetical protein Patl1_22344 [Pistacia atlantica]
MDSESQLRFNSRKQTIPGKVLSPALSPVPQLQLHPESPEVFSSFTAFLSSSYNNFTTVFLQEKQEGVLICFWFSSEEVSSQNQVKASVQRKIRQSIADEYPGLEPVLDDLLPKKSPLIVCKWCVTLLLLLLQLLISQNHLNLVLVNNVPLFFNIRDGPYMPTLRLLHQYPNIMKKLQVDRGAIRFVLAGANIMCPGLTSPGGALDEEVEAETPVVHTVLPLFLGLCYFALGHNGRGKAACSCYWIYKDVSKGHIQLIIFSYRKAINKGIGVDNMHYLNDGLWKMERLD